MKNKIIKIFPFLFLGLILFLPKAKADFSEQGNYPITFVSPESGDYLHITGSMLTGGNCNVDPSQARIVIASSTDQYATGYQGSYACPASASAIATSTFDFSSPVHLDAGHTYQIFFQWTGDRGATGYSYFTLNKTFGSDLSAEILYPVNSTSSYIHDFSHFTFKAKNQDSVSHIFTFQIVYDTTSTFTANPIAHATPAPFYTFGAGDTHYLSVAKPEYLATSTAYYAKLCTFEDANITQFCTDPITFTIGNNPYGYQLNTSQAGWFGSTTTESGILNNLNLASTTQVSNPGLICDTAFYNPANWVCWAYKGVTGAIDDLGRVAGLGIQRIVSTTQVVFPINLIYEFNADLNAVSATTSDVNITLTGQGSAWKKAGGGYYSFTLLSSSTAKQAEVATSFDWESIAVYFLYAMTGLAMLGIALVLLHNSSKPPNA